MKKSPAWELSILRPLGNEGVPDGSRIFSTSHSQLGEIWKGGDGVSSHSLNSTYPNLHHPLFPQKTGFRQTPRRGLLWAGGVGGGHWAGQGQTQSCDQSGCEDVEV